MNDFIFDLQLFDAESAVEDAEKEILDGAPEEMAESEVSEYTKDGALDLEDTDGAKNVVVPASVTEVKFNSTGGNVAQFTADNTTSEKTVSFGTGGDSAIIGKAGAPVTAKVNVNLGGGSDRVVNYGKNTFISLKNIAAMTGTPMLYAGNDSKMSINGAKAFALGVGIGLGVALSDLASSIKNLFSSMTNGIMTFANGGAIDFNFADADTSSADKLSDSDGNTVGTYDSATFSNTYTSDGTKIITGFTGNKGGTIDMSASNERFILYGNYNDDKISSVLRTGANDDFILAGSGDTVSAGAGTNGVYLTAVASRKDAANGAVIVAGDNSATTVDEFSYGFESKNDKLNVDGMGEMSIAYNEAGDGIVFENADSKSKTTLNIGTGTEAFRNVQLGDNSNATKITVVNNGASVSVTGANSYYGSNSIFDLSEYDGSANIDLSSEGSSTLGEENVSFTGFNQLRAGAGNTTLSGSSAKETLTAGTGNGTLWGAGGNDSLVGISGSGKEGTTTFRFVAGDGRDTISGFDVANDTVYTENEIRSVSVNGKNVVIGLNGDDKLTVENVSGTDFAVKVGDQEIKAQVGGSSLTYDGYATYYNAQGSNAKLTVSADAGKANVWLNQEVGANYGNTTQFFGEIVEIDGSRSSSSAVLVGSKDIDNKITASKGGSTVWGGGISNDTLIGGNGADSFYYMMGNGNDTIQSARANDQVVLNGISMSQITSTNVSSGAVVLNFSDGGTLTLNTNNGTTFKLGDESGDSYVTDKAGNWTKK